MLKVELVATHCRRHLQRSRQGNTDVVSRVTELEGHCTETSDRNMKKMSGRDAQ
jgi:hypothetical protein